MFSKTRKKLEEITYALKLILDLAIDINKTVKEKTVGEITSVDLMRKLLGSINLSDVELDPKFPSADDERAYTARAASFFREFVNEDTKRLILHQENWIARECDGNNQLEFARGTLNGILLMRERYETLANFDAQLIRDSKQGVGNEFSPLPEN